MNVIAILAHGRPECLQVQFEQLLKNEGIEDFQINIYLDHGFNSDALKTIKWLRKHHRKVRISHKTEEESKRSPLPAFYNICMAYADSVKYADEFVLFSEEDIIPTEDYIRFSRTAYDKFLTRYDRIFCVGHKRRIETELPSNPEYLVGDYQLTAPQCISVENIKKYILPEFKHPLFFSNPVEYNKQVHPNHRNPPHHHTHMDGQLERIADKHRLFSLKPDASRNMHIGVGGIFCKESDLPEELKTGTLEEKAEFYRNVIKQRNSEYLRRFAGHFKKDICIVDPKGWDWQDLHLDINRDKATASSWSSKYSFDPNNEFRDYILSKEK